MNKRKEADAAALAAGGNGASEDAGEGSSGAEGFANQLNNQPLAERLRNPFADDEDDDEDDERRGGSDDDDDDGDAGTSWPRRRWWESYVRPGRRGDGSAEEREGFGAGDNSSDEGDGEEEEFGDFAMPEHTEGEGATKEASAGTVLLKPLPVHPPAVSAGTSKFGSLWPFEGLSFTQSKDKEAVAGASSTNTKDSGEHVAQSAKIEDDDGEVVVGEDGNRVAKAVEAKRRTSIEDPDDDDEGVRV
jgi:hypothetical protein